MGLGLHEVPSPGCRRGYNNSIVMRLVTFRIIFLYLEPLQNLCIHLHVYILFVNLKLSFWTNALLAILPTCILLSLYHLSLLGKTSVSI